MKRVLFVAYHFPPLGGGGVQRSVKFVRYLPELGVEPVVVTGSGAGFGRWTPIDESLGQEVPNSVTVHRVPGREPGSSGWRRRADRWLRLESRFTRWWTEGVLATGRNVGRDVDVIYASMSPFVSGPACAKLAADLGKPWVADLRDPWALDEMMVFPTGVHRRLELGRMHDVLATAKAIVMNTTEATRQLRERFPDLATKPVLTIPNGFDREDFVAPAPARNDRAFRIVHAGHLHTEGGLSQRRTARTRKLLGGMISATDVLARSHVYLFEAINDVLANDPALRERLEVHLLGELSESDRRFIEETLRFPEVVRTHGYVSHSATVEFIRSADLLFLPLHDLPPGVRARTVPGKTYEYLASGRPILAALPDGDARDLVKQAEHAFVCRPTDVGAMAAFIGRQLVSEVPPGKPLPTFLAEYERRFLTSRLAELLESLSRASATSSVVSRVA